ncbi:transcriptional regulator GcvA [Motiliproteus sp. MSK22-1]|uniref:transcriptional regulator GcvA n=1 Tax=Motiliproteus sp. MSK22-1 TaxID=1897630 RepID=UPI0009781D03|nr:transcriptional regulator GcvA [Motiliproteus sp. MSK22-1]OMH32105.1 LysR family transcriptional regulator [Motiliproteus sp. MSK22-1]
MKKRLPPLNWLRSFEVSARHLNFTQAATELNLTQAAISQQVKGLESQLGVALFKRLPRGLELTEAGQAYMPAVHESIERLAAATDEIFGHGRSKLLTVRVNLVFFTTWLAPRIARFRKRHPDVGLRFTSNIWVEEKDKDADMEIRYGKGSWPGFKSDRLTWDELFPVCSPTLSDHAPLPDTPEELINHTLLHVIGYEEGWGYWLNQTGYQHLDASQGIQFDTLITALEMASLGNGFALGRTSLVSEMIANGRLVAPFEQRVATAEAFYLAYPAHQYMQPHAEAFQAWIIEEAEHERDQAENGTQ